MIAPDAADYDALEHTREAIARCGRALYERRLTDGAGGNISALLPFTIRPSTTSTTPGAGGQATWCMSPRYAAHRWQWRLRPEQVLALDDGGGIVAGEGETSRDLDVHRAIYDAVPSTGAIIHAHAPWSQVFAAAGAPIPPLLEAAGVLGRTPVLPGVDEPAELAAAFAEREERVAAFAASALVRGHGLVVAARDLNHALDALERCEGNARCALFAPLLKTTIPDLGPDGSARSSLSPS